MEFFRIHKDIPFMKHALVFNVISLITFLLAVFFLATSGLHFSRRVHRRHADGSQLQRAARAPEGARRAPGRLPGRPGAELRQRRDVLIRLCPADRGGVKRAGKVSSKGHAAPRARPAVDHHRQGADASRQVVGPRSAPLKRSEFTGPRRRHGLLLVIGGIVLYLRCAEWRSRSPASSPTSDVVIIRRLLRLFQWEFSWSSSPRCSPCSAIRSTSRW